MEKPEASTAKSVSIDCNGFALSAINCLAAKLFLIRRKLGLSQPKLAKVLGIREYTDISKYEHDKNEPSLFVLLAYSRASGIPLERIVDDDLPLDLSRISSSENAQI